LPNCGAKVRYNFEISYIFAQKFSKKNAMKRIRGVGNAHANAHAQVGNALIISEIGLSKDSNQPINAAHYIQEAARR
jgi:hypothetical protein